MHSIALVAQDAQNAETLREIFNKVDRAVSSIRASHTRQWKWSTIIKELKSEKALDNSCPVQLLPVRTNYRLFFNQELPSLVFLHT